MHYPGGAYELADWFCDKGAIGWLMIPRNRPRPLSTWRVGRRHLRRAAMRTTNCCLPVALPSCVQFSARVRCAVNRGLDGSKKRRAVPASCRRSRHRELLFEHVEAATKRHGDVRCDVKSSGHTAAIDKSPGASVW